MPRAAKLRPQVSDLNLLCGSAAAPIASVTAEVNAETHMHESWVLTKAHSVAVDTLFGWDGDQLPLTLSAATVCRLPGPSTPSVYFIAGKWTDTALRSWHQEGSGGEIAVAHPVISCCISQLW
jgi:hypothetical protein